ncbi:MAG: Histidine kinase [Campylobacterota bacterium]|nr:Histidine kinase [Campylobacterota bacterium]
MTLYSKIRIIFLVSLIFVSAFFASYFYIQKAQHFQKIEKRYIQTSLFLHKYFRQSARNGDRLDFDDPSLNLYLKESSFKLIDDAQTIKTIRNHAHSVRKRRVLHSRFEILEIKQRMYLWLKHPHFELLLEDQQENSFPWQIFFWYLISLAFLSGLYLWLTRSLEPLKILQERIHRVAQGDLKISFKSDAKDEIAEVSNAFDNALKKLESLIQSRQLFLRMIMHELKTPIGKGKLLNAFLEDVSQKESYEAVFERLELLIEEFSKVEQMLSAKYVLKVSRYNARDIIEQAVELMFIDEEEVQKQVHITEEKPLILLSDFELLSLAFKNLMDNAIKYSPDHRVSIAIKEKSIVFANKGARFTHNIQAYQQPFHEKRHGLGLGLYIVYTIMEVLKLKLIYTYENNENQFIITLPAE